MRVRTLAAMLLVISLAVDAYGITLLIDWLIWPYGPMLLCTYIVARLLSWMVQRVEGELLRLECTRLPIPFTPWQLRASFYSPAIEPEIRDRES